MGLVDAIRIPIKGAFILGNVFYSQATNYRSTGLKCYILEVTAGMIIKGALKYYVFIFDLLKLIHLIQVTP